MSIENYYNATKDNDMELLVADTMDKLEDTVSMTLGPYAKTTIVEDRMKKHIITKDGYTVLKNLFFENNLSRTIFEIVLKVSKNLVRTVGDGSTSSIVIANNVYKRLLPLINDNNISSKDILDVLQFYSKHLEEAILKLAKPISDDMSELADIAAISCNNDKNHGELIKEIFTKVGKYGFINLETSLTSDTYYEIKNGYIIPRGYISTLMANQPDKTSTVLDEPKVLMINGRITENDLNVLADFIAKFCTQIGGSLVIVASGYTSEVQTFFHVNRMNFMRKNQDELFKVTAIDIATSSKLDKDKFDDLAINLGATPIEVNMGDNLIQYDPDTLLTKCGTCKQFKGDEYNSKFIDGKGKKEIIEDRISGIEKKIVELTNREHQQLFDVEIYELKRRMALLKNSMATLYVGGESEQEKDTDKYLLEDAISACKSALEHGYIYGGNLIIPNLLYRKENDTYSSLLKTCSAEFKHIKKEYLEEILDIIFVSFSMSFRKVLGNFSNDVNFIDEVMDICLNENKIYNLKAHAYEDMDKTKIINSSQTDIEIMKTVFSIIGLVATSNQYVGINLNKPYQV